MTKDIVIFGITEFSEYMYYTILKECQYNVVAFSVDEAWLTSHPADKFCDLQVLPFEHLHEFLDMKKCGVMLTVGYKKMNGFREACYRRCKEFGYNVFTFISTRALVDSVEIGEGSIILPTAYIPPLTSIGVCNVINVGCFIGHTSKIGDFNWFSGAVTMGGNCEIANNCFIGMNSILSNGIKVASNTFISASSFVTSNTTEGKAYFGSPAINVKKISAKAAIEFV